MRLFFWKKKKPELDSAVFTKADIEAVRAQYIHTLQEVAKERDALRQDLYVAAALVSQLEAVVQTMQRSRAALH
jgi:hypothetical protein